jgi:hypothetical protein
LTVEVSGLNEAFTILNGKSEGKLEISCLMIKPFCSLSDSYSLNSLGRNAAIHPADDC